MPEKCIVFCCNNVRNTYEGIQLCQILVTVKMITKNKTKKMENWVDFVKSKRAYSEPTRHSEVCVEHLTSQTKPTQIDLLI